MTKILNRPWAVTAHKPIEKIDDNLWAVEGQLPGTPIMRRMCIIKRSDGSLLFYHAIPLSDAELDEIRAWGKPAYLVVGNHQHMVDAHAFREKLGLKLYGPKECAKQIRARTTLDGTIEDIPKDASVEVIATPGTRYGEPSVIVKSGNGARASILFCDAVQNTPKEGAKPLIKFLGFTGASPKVVPLFRLLFLVDRTLLKQALLGWANIPNLTRIIPFHGRVLESGASEALRSAANDLSS